MTRWILKIKPAEFRLAECLREVFLHDGVVALENRNCNPQEHDVVYLYQVSVDRGLCGVATVLAPSAPREQPHWQQKHGNPGTYKRDASRVLLQVEAVAPQPIATKWTANSGSMQECPDQAQGEFDRLAQLFITAEVDADNRVERAEYVSALRMSETDREVTALMRLEQAYWRRTLIGNARYCACALCGRTVPRNLIVIAHIKRRSECTHQERLDENNVMPACLLGCDALFEKQYITVLDGRIVGNLEHVTSPAVCEFASRLHDTKVFQLTWNAERAKYFALHAAGSANSFVRHTGADGPGLSA